MNIQYKVCDTHGHDQVAFQRHFGSNQTSPKLITSSYEFVIQGYNIVFLTLGMKGGESVWRGPPSLFLQVDLFSPLA